MRLLFALLAGGLVGCTMEHNPGTVVGNPGSSAMRVASGTGIDTLEATVGVSVVRWTGCDGVGVDVAWDADVDLVSGRGLDAPVGTWCEVQVVFASALLLDGSANPAGGVGDVAMTMELDAVTLVASTPFVVGETPLVLELGFPGWFDVGDLEPAVRPNEGFSLEPGDSSHDALVGVIALSSGLYVDADDDGVLDGTERDAGSLAEGARRPRGR